MKDFRIFIGIMMFVLAFFLTSSVVSAKHRPIAKEKAKKYIDLGVAVILNDELFEKLKTYIDKFKFSYYHFPSQTIFSCFVIIDYPLIMPVQ